MNAARWAPTIVINWSYNRYKWSYGPYLYLLGRAHLVGIERCSKIENCGLKMFIVSFGFPNVKCHMSSLLGKKNRCSKPHKASQSAPNKKNTGSMKDS